ncbi:MAG TPA: SPOR domain-containing protein [Butyricimonas virosa]|uniref:SPOR domain-containing protein n=1 Tax=Butyricimonas virosa TaxID=544645 RepID=A0A921H3M4_9BACT|nr:SPOR domain-containing protein [Butyricimonas virosa]
MKFVLFLSFVLMLPFIGCQRDKMNSKNLTTANVKRSLPASLPENHVSLDTIRQNPSQNANNTTIASNVKISPSRQETGKQQGTEQSTKKIKTKSYHIIVASHPRENLAEKDVTQLKAKGFPEAQIITKDQRYRVSIANYTDKQEATKQRDLLATQLGQSDIWIMLY